MSNVALTIDSPIRKEVLSIVVNGLLQPLEEIDKTGTILFVSSVTSQPQSTSISSPINHPLSTASASTQPKTPSTFRITYSRRKTKPVKTTPPPTTSAYPTSPNTSPSSQPKSSSPSLPTPAISSMDGDSPPNN
ncbi:hypothetical protein E3N88_05348 [Mikania micrantha]|uniref:Uncharacterized protein n=1 Tax=Mikania micrantha TaxID=192012 RepID=A0A5N6PLH0_9ASTR|nr:hypothetical protein E3N88_05348 [Mikania micrantha]